MSVRVLRSSFAEALPVYEWPGSVPPPQSAPPTPEPTPAPDAAWQAERSAMQMRIAELERSLAEQTARAHAEGLRAGEQAGRQQAHAELKPLVDRLGQSLHELDQFRPRLRQEAEAGLVKLALQIAKRILHRELTVDPGAMEGLIRIAFEKLRQREITRVRVHPSLENDLRAYFAAHATSRQLQLVADPALAPGAILFDTPNGSLDCSIDTQLREIERGFTDRLNA